MFNKVKKLTKQGRNVEGEYFLSVRWLDILHWLIFFNIFRKKQDWPGYIENAIKSKKITNVCNQDIAITFINHSTFLIQGNEINILTDPFFSKRASPLQWIGPKRIRNPGLTLEHLPKIDIVLVSHNHYDHMDIPTLLTLKKMHDPLFISGQGNAIYLRKKGITKVLELNWWESTVHKDIIITMTPARHFSGRSLFDINQTKCGGFVIQFNKKKLFFAGDTGYYRHFEEIYQVFGSIDFAFLPIGAYKTSAAMSHGHMTPKEAVKAHLDLKSKQSIGMHFGTLQLSLEKFNEPVYALQQALVSLNVKEDSFCTLEFGEKIWLRREILYPKRQPAYLE